MLLSQVKCDRTPGSCRKCDKFGAECAYTAAEPRTRSATSPASRSPGNGIDNGITKAGLARRRTPRSCVECQRTKAKCSGEILCGRCDRKGLPCLYRDAGGDNARAPTPRSLIDASMPAWLLSRILPPVHRVRELLDMYFARVHTVRCLGFLHVPTFMERFQDDGEAYEDPSGLVHIMCALAAPFYYAHAASSSSSSSSSSEDGLQPSTRFHEAGRGWAATAMERMFANFGSPAVECLMAAVLLHEQHLRVGDHAKAFLVSGIVARHVQILQLNVEHDGDVLCERPGAIPWAVKESRRRLFWACYLQDAFIECGIDQLRFISADDVQIQLPCLEDYFIRNRPCVTEMLRQGTVLPFVEGDSRGRDGANLDLRSFYIRAMVTRSRVLKYVKHLEGDVPWSATQDSRFQQLDGELVAIENSIPDVLRMTPENVYLYKASGRLNVYFGLHILLAQTFNDLYRVGVSGLVFPFSATKWIRDNAPSDFITRCHRVCASKAAYIATLLDDLYKCHKESMVDIPYAMHAQVCSGVLVTTLASWTGRDALLPGVGLDDYARMLESNVRVLQHLRRYMKVDLFLESATQALKRFDSMRMREQRRSGPVGEDGELNTDAGENVNPRQFSLDYILNPLGVYPIARTQASDRHKPEEFAAAAAAATAARPLTPSTTASTRGQSADELMALEDPFPGSGAWDWSQMPFLESMGYPTFLENEALVHGALDSGDASDVMQL